jgi:hypothetical protein
VEHKGEHTLPSKNAINDRPLSHLPGVRERRRRMTSEHRAVVALTESLERFPPHSGGDDEQDTIPYGFA